MLTHLAWIQGKLERIMSETVLEEPTTFINLSTAELIEQSIRNKEGMIAANKALRVSTGERTGRSPKDRYIVKDQTTTDTIDWGNINQPMARETFSNIFKRAQQFLSTHQHYVAHLNVGAEEEHSIPVEVITETAWHNLFARHLFIRTEGPFADNKELWTIVNAPSVKVNPMVDGTHSDGIIALDFTHKQILICGIAYAGEMKKAMFSVLNYLLPEQNVLPMHCAANVGQHDDVTLFFGLSGTGKTTLSADPDRLLIGDDEHGWSSQGIFNFEGGCYAKCIDLSPEKEPLIHSAIRSGAIMENVVLDPHTLQPNYHDSRITQNTRAAYPLEHIANRVETNVTNHPNAIVFLSCDLFGVLPPVALLNKQQAIYYFLSGYTALVGSTEMESDTRIRPTFSACFGAPFFPRKPQVYADLLAEKIDKHNTKVYLVNTGWTGGSYPDGGSRFSIDTSRQVIKAIVNNDLQTAEMQTLPGFNLQIPAALPGLGKDILDPRQAWSDQNAYQTRAKELIEKFEHNIERFKV